jgi:hypothetical protein
MLDLLSKNYVFFCRAFVYAQKAWQMNFAVAAHDKVAFRSFDIARPRLTWSRAAKAEFKR